VSYFSCGVNEAELKMASARESGGFDEKNECILKKLFAYHRRFAYDFHFSKLFENFTVHAVSMTLHAPCMRYL
jgi:hypothetical protein